MFSKFGPIYPASRDDLFGAEAITMLMTVCGIQILVILVLSWNIIKERGESIREKSVTGGNATEG
jgi:hypothetical protein